MYKPLNREHSNSNSSGSSPHTIIDIPNDPYITTTPTSSREGIDFTAITIPEASPPATASWFKASLYRLDFYQFSKLLESSVQCFSWQAMSDYLAENTQYRVESVAHWGFTGAASGSTALLRGLVMSMRDTYSNNGVNLTAINIDMVVSWISESLSNAAWQPAYAIATQYTGPGMEFFVTGVISALIYFIALVLMRFIASKISINYKNKHLTSEQFSKDVYSILFQVLPVASYFVQTNSNYLISALKVNNHTWMDAAKAAACGAIGYSAGYIASWLIYFLQCALPYLMKLPHFVGWMLSQLKLCCGQSSMSYQDNDADDVPLLRD